jgi:uncharacterized membrane protein
MNEWSAKGRILEIDITKGIACLLMLAAHFISARLLPFGTFAAPLFFACSGMNTIKLLEKTSGNRRYDLFHLFFPLLLFFGGSTQVVVAHGGRLRIFPEFLQCIALAVFVLFVLSRVIRNPFHVGCLFPVPFLIQHFLPLTFFGSPLAFLFSKGFALFPWLGFFLFGVFILYLKGRTFFRLTAVLGATAVVSLIWAGDMPNKFLMSPLYILLALLAVSLFFALGRLIAALSKRAFFRGLTSFFAIPGRNSLMFVYLHYFVLRNFVGVDLFHSFYPDLLFPVLYLFCACWVLLLIYEKVRHETELLIPALSLLLALGALRWGGLLNPRIDLRLIDMIIGILFAFAYVLLRRKFAAWCERGKAAVAGQ